MVDPFVILAPVLLLAVVALLRFVGCAGILGLDDVKYVPVLGDLDITISPESAIVGGPPFTLTVNGSVSDFFPGAEVLWNGRRIPPTPALTGSTRQLTVQIPASDIATVGFASVQVSNPGSHDSNVVEFTIKDPLNITSLDPPSKLVCQSQFTLKVFGTGFVSGSQVQWNDGSNPLLSLTTRLVSGHLEADVPANLIEELAPGPPGGSAVKKTVKVTVFNPAPGGGTSTPLPFDIVPGTPPNSVRFDPKPAQVANSGDILNGTYKNIDFLINQWIWSGQPNGAVISPTTSAPSNFSFVNGERILASLIVFATAVGQIKLSDGGTNPDVQRSFTSAEVGLFHTVPTNWTKCAKTVKYEFSALFPVLEIVYLGPP